MNLQDKDEEANLRAMLAMGLLIARMVNKPAGPSVEQLVDESVRAADLMIERLKP